MTDVATAETGRLVVFGTGVGGDVTVWDVRRDRSHRLRGEFAGALAVDRGGQLLAAGDLEGHVLIWDLSRIRPRFLGALTPRLRASVAAVAFAPTGGLIAAEDFNGAITVWDLHGNRVVASASAGPQADRSTVRFSADGRVLAATGPDGRVALFRLGAFRPKRLRGLDTGGDVRSLAVDARGHRVLAAANDGMILWNLEAGPRLGSQSFLRRSKA